MRHSRVLQPNVCCIGNPVAGNPTQFVMYRAARAAGLDWRFFTSQVALDQFETAFRGVQSLGLDGVALFDPFQTSVVPLLDTVTETVLATGKVNVARSDSGSWIGDNTLGAAIAKCIDDRHNSERSESPGNVMVVDAPLIATIIGLASPQQKSNLRSVSSTQSSKNPTNESAMESAEETLNPSIQGVEKKNGECESQSIDFVAMSKIPGPSGLRFLAGLQWNRNASCLVLECPSEKQLRPLRSFLESRSIQWIEPVELLAHQAAADFQFWTGMVPSVELIRESLEEYLQW